MALVSNFEDNNIFHNFAFDIILYYHPRYKKAIINSDNIDLQHPVQKWRYFVFKKIYAKVEYKKYVKKKHKKYYKGYDFSNFINYEQSKHMINIYNKLTKFTFGEYILLVQRGENNRYLYDYSTKLKIEDYLKTKNLKIPIRVCNFENMTPQEQYDICSKCLFFIAAHGAGCTNIIFTPKMTPLIEINFRKHWYCDPVCDKHIKGEISINSKCNGRLKFKPQFHKADYHNLCHLINKKYIEMEAIEYSEGFLSKNPICKQKIYIDGNVLIERINFERSFI